MSTFKSHFAFNRSQQNGILLLVAIIVVLQLIYFYADFGSSSEGFEGEDAELVVFQQKLDSIKEAAATGTTDTIYPFNPNYITDYRGYMLGMSLEEIDRLHQYRAGEKWVNSAEEFQEVTKISDSLLHIISPSFQFPDWVTNSRETVAKKLPTQNNPNFADKSDLNSATTDELMEVRGIGETLSGRIVNYRNKIGGFVDDLQLKDVYGLNYEVRGAIEAKFTVKSKPDIVVLNINKASVLELSEVPYFGYELAREIVNYRLLHEEISSFEELAKIKDFPSEKIDGIALYLTLE